MGLAHHEVPVAGGLAMQRSRNRDVASGMDPFQLWTSDPEHTVLHDDVHLGGLAEGEMTLGSRLGMGVKRVLYH